MLTIVFLFVCYVSVFIITVLLCLLLLCMLFLICMVLNICNFIQRTEQVPVELDISAIEEYILLLFKKKSLKCLAIILGSDIYSLFIIKTSDIASFLSLPITSFISCQVLLMLLFVRQIYLLYISALVF